MRAALHVPVPEARKNCDRAATAAPVVAAEGDPLTGALTVGQIAPSADSARLRTVLSAGADMRR